MSPTCSKFPLRLFVTFWAFVLLLGACAAFANDAPVKSVGKAIQPLKDVPVQMVAEKVDITVVGDFADVNCIFTLKNEGKPGIIEVGFPRGWESDLEQFVAVIENTPLEVKTLAEEPSAADPAKEKLPWWKVFKVSFDSTGQTVTVRNHYYTRLIRGGEYPSPINDYRFTYIMTTGAPWKGTIEDGEITVTLFEKPFEQLTVISPKGYTREDKRLVWRFKDFEPTWNIELNIMQDIYYDRMVIARTILEKEPRNAYGHFLLGSVYYNRMYMKDFPFEKAEKELREAISLDPNLLDARWFLACLLARDWKTKQLKEIKGQLDSILAVNPQYHCEDKTFHGDDNTPANTPGVLLSHLKMNGWK
jgi:hypothetical protein